MWLRRSVFALALSLSVSLSLSAQPVSLPSTGSDPTASNSSLTSPADSWSTLNSLLDQLDQAAIDSSTGSQELRELLAKAQQQLTALSQQLDESQKRATALSSSLALSEQSLLDSATLLKSAQTSVARRSIELWITRGAVAASLTWAIVEVERR
jgi:TolA-binding protein